MSPILDLGGSWKTQLSTITRRRSPPPPLPQEIRQDGTTLLEELPRELHVDIFERLDEGEGAYVALAVTCKTAYYFLFVSALRHGRKVTQQLLLRPTSHKVAFLQPPQADKKRSSQYQWAITIRTYTQVRTVVGLDWRDWMLRDMIL